MPAESSSDSSMNESCDDEQDSDNFSEDRDDGNLLNEDEDQRPNSSNRSNCLQFTVD